MSITIGDVVKPKGCEDLGRVCDITPGETYLVTFDGKTTLRYTEEFLEHASGSAPGCEGVTTGG